MEYPESQQNSHALYQIQYAGLHLGAIQRLYGGGAKGEPERQGENISTKGTGQLKTF